MLIFSEVPMSHSITRMIPLSECEDLIRDVNDFIASNYDEANARARLAHIYEHGMEMEAFAFPIHHPGSPESAHLPGFALDALPDSLAALCRAASQALGLERGRMLFNVSRYPEDASALPAHYDGELFDYTVESGQGNTVRRGIRPTQVALLTLRNETERCGTTLHDLEGKVIETQAQAGELLIFDNTVYQHAVSETGPNVKAGPEVARPRWARFTIGWRALEEGFYWNDAEALRPIEFSEAIEMHDRFLAKDWSEQLLEDLSRATFPFPNTHS